MENKKTNKVYVVGHKNPDTDSICSVIAYANLKKVLTGREYVAKRAGQLNEETQYVLNRFGAAPPALLTNVRLQVKDIAIHRMAGIMSNVSIKEAWELMKKENMKTLPITREDKLEGLITIGDIATSYMDVYESTILATARTQYRNIVSTLNGTMITGNEHGYFVNGKVVIAASSPELMENFIEKDDLVILGNRYESQLCALEMDASCLVICQGVEISKTIKKMAETRSIVVISTPHDTFTAARLINQSIPVKHFMSRENLTVFSATDYVEDIKDVMTKKRYRDFPVVDKRERFMGFISRRRIMDSGKKQVILIDHNEKTQAVDGIEEAEILEIIDHHRLGSIETMGPVYFRNQPVGCTATIIYQMYGESNQTIDATIAALLCSAIVSDTLMFRSPTCTEMDKNAAEELARIADLSIEELARDMFNAGSNLKGKTAEEICFQDFKQFSVNGETVGVGQMNSMNIDELQEVKESVAPYMKKAMKDQRLDKFFYMLTNIIEESTELLCCGMGAKELIIDAFDLSEEIDDIVLKDVVSRKKQLVPTIVSSLQQ
ncbi:MAG: putative manganese-dependent inorganic diphosphatase [Lachnospiraceae bacterium]